jgi:hypothetical protein
MKNPIVPDPVAGDSLAAANFDTIVARTVGQRHGSASTLAAATAGLDGIAWVKTAGVTNGQLALLDANNDWRDRVIHGSIVDLSAAANQPQGANYYNNWPPPSLFAGYTGTGALSDTGTGAAVSNGNPPVWGTGGGGTSTAVTAATNVYLYADPTTGALYIYNATVNPIYVWLQLSATADLGLR